MITLSALFLAPIKALLIAALVFVPFERIAHLRPQQPLFRKGWATDALTGVVNGFMIYAALLIVLGRMDAIGVAGWPRVRDWMETRSIWEQSIVAVLVGDLGLYAMHRFSHTVPWLWRFHVVHHSAEEMDWLIGFRFHPLDLFLTRVATLALPVALGVSPAAMAVLVAVFGWNSWLVHANVRLRYGALKFLVVSPEFHHWHHSAEREAHNRNYASVVACWDVLFRTAHLPAGRMPIQYGVEEHVPDGWVGRFFHPFRRRGDYRPVKIELNSSRNVA